MRQTENFGRCCIYAFVTLCYASVSTIGEQLRFEDIFAKGGVLVPSPSGGGLAIVRNDATELIYSVAGDHRWTGPLLWKRDAEARCQTAGWCFADNLEVFLRDPLTRLGVTVKDGTVHEMDFPSSPALESGYGPHARLVRASQQFGGALSTQLYAQMRKRCAFAKTLRCALPDDVSVLIDTSPDMKYSALQKFYDTW